MLSDLLLCFIVKIFKAFFDDQVNQSFGMINTHPLTTAVCASLRHHFFDLLVHHQLSTSVISCVITESGVV